MAAVSSVKVCLMVAACSLTLVALSALAATSVESSAHQSLRLPSHLLPSHYSIKLIPFLMEGNFTTGGQVWVTMSCVQSSYSVVFNINNITIDAESVSLQDVSSGQILSIIQQNQNNTSQKYTLVASGELRRGHEYLLYIKFTSVLNDLLEGLYRSSYTDKDSGQLRWLATSQFSPTSARCAFPCWDEPLFKANFTISLGRQTHMHSWSNMPAQSTTLMWLATSQFSPTDARRAFPCWDEPLFKANFTISLGRQTHMQSWSNMPVQSTTPIEDMDGWEWDNYPMTVPMSTYLVAFMVSDFQSTGVVTLPSGPKFQVITRKDELPYTKYAASIGPKILTFLEDYFKIKFPLPKLDMAAIPDFGFSAMENWGFITFRESILLYDPEKDSMMAHDKTATVIAHELAHQWFGNLVTPGWWADLWLKEGFATFIGYLAMNHVEPDRRYTERFVIDNVQTVMGMDSLLSSHQISVPLEDPTDITQIFDAISYKKGASIIRMMQHFLGKEQFKAGLTSYLKQFAYNNTFQDQLWQVLNNHRNMFRKEEETFAAEVRVKDVMDSWTLQVGYPVVTVTRDYESGVANLMQERFLLSKGSNDKTLWWIPLSYTTKREKLFSDAYPKLWLNNKHHNNYTISNVPSNDWLLVNVNQTGFFRVNYDERNWQLLTAELNSLPELTRAQLLSDALNLAAAGRTPYRVALDLTKQLYDDHSYLTWTAVKPEAQYIHDMLVGTPTFNNFKEYVLKLLRVQVMSLTVDPTHLPDNLLDRMHHFNIINVALQLDFEPLVAEVKSLVALWVSGQKLSVLADVREMVYCTAIRNGDENVWQYFWTLYLESKATDRVELLNALGCSADLPILSRYLNMSLDENSKVRKQDGTTVFLTIAKNKKGHHLAFDFLINRWHEIQDYFGLGFNGVSNMIRSLSHHLKTPKQLQQLQELQHNHSADLGSTAQAMNSTIERVSNNVNWLQDYLHEVDEWLAQAVLTM